MHLVGFIIRIYHDAARSPERQKCEVLHQNIIELTNSRKIICAGRTAHMKKKVCAENM